MPPLVADALVGEQRDAVIDGPAVDETPGSPFATGANPYSVALSPNGALLATANLGDSTVTTFVVGP